MFRKVKRLGSSAAKLKITIEVEKLTFPNKQLVGSPLSLVFERGGKQLSCLPRGVVDCPDSKGSMVDFERQTFEMSVTLYKNAAGKFHDKNGRIIIRQSTGRGVMGKETFTEIGVVLLAIHTMVAEDMVNDCFSEHFSFPVTKSGQQRDIALECQITTRFAGNIELDDDNMSVISGASDLASVQGGEASFSGKYAPPGGAMGIGMGAMGGASSGSTTSGPIRRASSQYSMAAVSNSSVMAENESLKSQLKILTMNLERSNADNENLALLLKEKDKTSNTTTATVTEVIDGTIAATPVSPSGKQQHERQEEERNVAVEILKVENKEQSKKITALEQRIEKLNSMVGAEAISMATFTAEMEAKDTEVTKAKKALEECMQQRGVHLSDLAEAKSSFEEKISALKEQLSTTQNELEDTRAKLTEQLAENDVLKTQAADRLQVAEDAKMDTNQLKASLVERETALREQEELLAATQLEMEEARVALAQGGVLRKEMEERAQAVTEAAADNAGAELLAERETQKAELKQLQSSHREEVSALQKSLAAAVLRQEELEGELRVAGRSLEETTVALRVVKSSLEEKERECESQGKAQALKEETTVVPDVVVSTAAVTMSDADIATAVGATIGGDIAESVGATSGNASPKNTADEEGQLSVARALFHEQLQYLTTQLEHTRQMIESMTVHMDEERLKSLAVKKCLMKFTRRLSAEDNKILHDAGVILA